MTLVNVFHLPVTSLKNRNAAKHGTLFTVDHVEVAPNIIIPRMKRTHAVLFAHTSSRDERTHAFTPYSALNAFSAYALRSDVITSTNHRSRCSRCSKATRINHKRARHVRDYASLRSRRELTEHVDLGSFSSKKQSRQRERRKETDSQEARSHTT